MQEHAEVGPLRVWAETFSHRAVDALLVLDAIGDRIVASIASEIEALERDRAILRPPDSLNAWEAHHRGLWHMYRFSKADNERARHCPVPQGCAAHRDGLNARLRGQSGHPPYEPRMTVIPSAPMKRTNAVLAALALGLALLGGCAVTHEQARDQFAGLRSCCAGYAEFPYRPIAAGETAIVDIGSKSPGFAFPVGKSFFEAFRLPDRRGAAWVRLRSYAQGDRIDRAHVFFPNVLMLDESFRVVAEIVPHMAALKGSQADAVKENDWGMPARLQGEVALAPNCRYLVLRTTDALLAGQSSYLERIDGLGAIGAAAGMVPQGTFSLKHSPIGRVAVDLVAD